MGANETDGSGAFSVAFPRQWWYPACASRELKGRKPLGITLMDQPIVLFRDRSARPQALVDRCPHRNVPLSIGRVSDDGCLQCGYHGWRFDGDGHCTAIPGLTSSGPTSSRNRDVGAWPVTESGGFVWVWGEREGTPTRDPFSMPALEGSGTGEVVLRYDMDTTIHAACENDLDVPHTAFLHAGLWRGATPREITAKRRELPDGIEVQYLGEPVGMAGLRLGKNTDMTFDHWDRFFLPSISQIEYRVEGWLRIVNTVLHLPLSPLRTRAWFTVRYWTRFPAAAVRPLVIARGRQIARQDVRILGQQTQNMDRFGGEHITSTELDVMGSAIWRLLRQAEKADGDRADNRRGAVPPVVTEPTERTVTLRI